MRNQKQLSVDNSVATSSRHKKTHTRYAVTLLTGVAFLGNVTAVTGLVLSHADVLIITAAVLAVLGGLYLLLRCWDKPVGWYTMLIVAIVITGSVALALSLQTYHANSTNQTRTANSPAAENTTNSRAGGKPIQKNSSHTVVFEKEYTINATEGLELDDETGTILLRQSEAKAPADLYFSDTPLLYVSIKNFYPYKPATRPTSDADTDQYEACSSIIEANPSATDIVGPSSVVPGLQYCIFTTQGRVALVTLKEMVNAGYQSTKSTVSFTVKLWN